MKFWTSPITHPVSLQLLLLLPALNLMTALEVAITPPSVKDDFYPEGCHGVLGYGVDPAPDLPSDSTLLGVYLP